MSHPHRPCLVVKNKMTPLHLITCPWQPDMGLVAACSCLCCEAVERHLLLPVGEAYGPRMAYGL